MNDAQRELMSLMAEDPARARELIHRLIEERAAADPVLAQVVRSLVENQRAPDTAGETEADTIDLETARLRRSVSDMEEDLEELYARNEEFAAAVGACASCWGDDPSCPDCRGRGRAGWRKPHAGHFRRLVAPALRHLPRPDPESTDRRSR